MVNVNSPYRLIISGGGTGGHIFPALAIATAFVNRHPNTEILFVGAKDKMEMVRVPEAGYKIIGLWIDGLQRNLSLSNLLFPLKLAISFFKARKILKSFKPHVVIGTGGFASGPIMFAATREKIPTVIQEQNSYAGLTNKWLAGRVDKICVAYKGMGKYFPEEKIIITGNPVRGDISKLDFKKEKALSHFGFSSEYKTLLVLGGSLGARTINESILAGLQNLIDSQVQVIWQTGKYYFEEMKERVKGSELKRILIFDFLKNMDLAYAAADVVVSRAGALAISELSLAGKPSILIPSPNVVDDHQTKNAMALVNEGAAILTKDSESKQKLVTQALDLVYDDKRCCELKKNISKLARVDAANEIAGEIEKLIDTKVL